jgi:Zn-dependent protease with chaperone function
MQESGAMRRWLVLMGVASVVGVAQGEDITQVLERSQSVRLERMSPAPVESARAQKVRDSFEMLAHRLGLQDAVELRVVRGEVVAETLQGRVVIVNEGLGDWSEEGRLFVLAHELGHVALAHWAQMGVMYQKWVPGSVTPEQTDPVAGRLGREASGLAYQQEYEADAFALRTLEGMGVLRDTVISAFMRLGVTKDTATHPGTHRRLAALRAQ